MRMLKYLLEKEFKQIRRDRFLPRIIFLLPVIQLVVLPFAANFEMRNINLSIVDNDHTVLSRRLTDKVLSSGYFRLADVSPRYDEALVSIESNAADIILEIPSRFEERLEREGTAELLIAANAVNGTKGGIGSSYLASIIQDFNQEKELSSVSAGEGGIRVTNLFNPHLSYKNYMVPGIMAFLLTLIGGFLSALNIVSEKEKGTIEQINVTPAIQVGMCTTGLVSALQTDTVLGYRSYPAHDRRLYRLACLRVAAGRQYGDHLSVRCRLPDGVYRFRLGDLVRFVHPATGDVHGFLLYDYFCPPERYVYTGQQYAGLGTGTDTCQSAPLFSRSDADGLSERQHFVRPYRALHCRLPVRSIL